MSLADISGALYGGVEENLNLVTDAINAEIKGAIGNCKFEIVKC